MVKFEFVKDFDNYNITEKYCPFHTYILGASCSSDKTKCSPYKAPLYKGKYKFELWGSGSTFHPNGAYVSGELNIEQQLTLFFFVGPNESPFNSVEIGDNIGYLGNGATDIRLFYDGKWDSFESLRSRIIVAGAGGNSLN